MSVELNMDRRTIGKHLTGLTPCGITGRSKLYYMADVVAAIYAKPDRQGKEEALDLDKEKALVNQERARQLKRENDVEERVLIPIEELTSVLSGVSAQAVSILDALPLNIKRRVPMLKARDIEYIKKEIAKSRNSIAKIEVV